MKILLLISLVLAGCSHSKAKPESSSPAAAAPVSAPSESMQKPLSQDQIEALHKAASLREEGLRVLYAKDPRVKNPKKAFELLLEAANLGDPLAMDSVGGFYSSGQGGAEKSCSKAMEWFEKAATSGYGLAANNLAYLYVTCSEKKKRDPAKAEAILRMMFAKIGRAHV